MTDNNHPNRKGQFELTFWGGAPVRYKRHHQTLESARVAAYKVLEQLDNAAAHPAIIHGPGLGKDGLTIS